MEITDVRVRKVEMTGRMRAIVSVTIDDAFVVHDIKVIEGDKGYFIAMPSRRGSNGEFRDVAHPIHQEVRDRMQEIILKAYEESLREADDRDAGNGAEQDRTEAPEGESGRADL